jgi:holliday junction DNA helicase RuvA
LMTILQVKEENVNVYGFASEATRDLYRALTTVSGVGPKVALAVLSAFTPEALASAITAGDAGALESVPGVGKRTAGRIVLDLKDKLGVAAEVGAGAAGSSSLAEVREALKGLGYSPQEIQPVLTTLPPDGDVPTLLRHALRSLGGGETVEPAANGSPRKGKRTKS